MPKSSTSIQYRLYTIQLWASYFPFLLINLLAKLWISNGGCMKHEVSLTWNGDDIAPLSYSLSELSRIIWSHCTQELQAVTSLCVSTEHPSFPGMKPDGSSCLLTETVHPVINSPSLLPFILSNSTLVPITRRWATLILLKIFFYSSQKCSIADIGISLCLRFCIFMYISDTYVA